jgi:hypothetical protein
MGVQKRIGTTLVLATAMIAGLGIAHAQSASDILVRALARKPGCGAPAFQVEIINMSTEFYLDVRVSAEFINMSPGPAHCRNGEDCSGKIELDKYSLAPCGLPGYCAEVDGGDSTGFPTCCNVPSEKCNTSSAYCVTAAGLEVSLDGFSSDGITWTTIEPEVVCKYPPQDGFAVCPTFTECRRYHPELACNHPACLVQ